VSENRRLNSVRQSKQSPNPKPAATGRVTHDSRGNAVWKFALGSEDSSASGLVRSLTDSAVFTLETEEEPQTRCGGDPYNRSR
jgi:hypothetical protein